MRFRTLLLAAAAAVGFAAAAEAQPAGDQPGGPHHRSATHGVPGQKSETPPPSGQAAGQPAPTVGQHPVIRHRGPVIREGATPPPVVGPTLGQQTPPVIRHRGPVIQPPVTPAPVGPTVSRRRAPPVIRHAPTLPPLAGWDRTVRGPDRDHLGQQWRSQHRDWDSRAPWRRDHNWWRRDRGFRFYFGPRIGFFYIPDFGYIAAPPEYRGHYWRAGEYLPSWFWRYEVRNYAAYGLPTPPPGCAWVWVDGDVALIDLSDGYILDIVHNVW